jgi:hypothetical protein
VRIWDVPPGYLDRLSLLGEHRELHGLFSILVSGKTGYSHHPETIRWVGCVAGLCRRHDLLVAEMRLRGYDHLSPLTRSRTRMRWPGTFVDEPRRQYSILRAKYRTKEQGRLPLPRTARQLWEHHRYSVLARNTVLCRAIDRRVTRGADLASLSTELVLLLRDAPPPRSLTRAADRVRRDGQDLITSTLATELVLHGGETCLPACS